MGHYVYKYVYNDEIIYIGKNDTDLYSRLKQHGKCGDNIPEEGWDEINNSNIFYCELPNSTMSDVVESELIRRYKPKWNKAKMSEWSGLDFVEPKWKKAFENNSNEILKEKEREISILRSRLDKCEKEISKLREKARYKNDYYLLCIKYDSLIDKLNDKCISTENSYEFNDVCDWYKQTDSLNGIFEAITYDSKQNVTSYKKIYIDHLGRLYFEFEQINRLPAKGIIFHSKTDTYKSNWQVLRGWLNSGTNEYIKIA